MRTARLFEIVLGSLLAVVALTGCSQPKQPAVQAAQPASAAQGHFEAAWDATLEVLRGYQFRIDQQDRYQGLITTYPATGKTWFEFWRKDGATACDTFESSIQTIYRRPIVHITRVGETDNYEVSVEVKVTRADRPVPQIANVGEALELFQTPEGRLQSKYLMNFGQGVDTSPVPLPDDKLLAAQIKIAIDSRTSLTLAGAR